MSKRSFERYAAFSARRPALSPRELWWLALPLFGLVAAVCAGPALGATVDSWDVPGEVRYLRDVHERVHPRWQTFLNGLEGMPVGTRFHDDGTLSTELVLGVDPDGRVVRTEMVARSGLEGFDQAPVDLVHDLGKLPPPPKSLRSDDGLVYLRWRFARDGIDCEQRGVVERRLPPDEAVARLVSDGRVDTAVERVRELEAADSEQGAAAVAMLARAVARAAAADPVDSRRAAGAAALAHDPGPAAEALLLRLVSDDKDRAVRRTAMAALGTPGRSQQSLALLVAALAGDDATLAVRALAQRGDRRALPPLRRMLAEGRIAVEVTRALRTLGDSDEAAQIVARMLESGASRRAAATQAACELGDPSLASALMAGYRDARQVERGRVLMAIAAMGERAPPEARHQVMMASSDPSPSVRAIAAEAMGGFGEHSMGLRYRLMDQLQDADAPVRARSAASLVFVGGVAVRDELVRSVRDADAGVRAAVGSALVRHPFDGSLPLAARLAADPDEDVRAAVYAAIPSHAAADLRALRARAATDPSGAVRSALLPPSTPVHDAAMAAAWLLRADGPAERLEAAAEWLACADHSTEGRVPSTREAQAAVTR